MSDSTNTTDISRATVLTLSNQDLIAPSWVDLASSGTTTYATSDSTDNISLIDPNQYRHVTPNRGSWLSNTTHISNAPDSNSGIPGEIFSEPSGIMWVKSCQGWRMVTPQDLGGMDPFETTVPVGRDDVEKGEKRKLKCF